MKIKMLPVFLCLTLLSACISRQPSKQLLGGYKVWVMNSQEVYLADRNNELLVGPGLRKIGVAKRSVVAFCDPPSPGYIGNLKTVGYSVLDVSTGTVTAGLSEQSARALMADRGESFPEMASFDVYPVLSQ